MDATTGWFLVIYGIFCFGLGFYCNPKYNELKARFLKWLGGTTKVVSRGDKKVLKPAKDIVILGKYAIDDYEFTVIEKPGIEDYDRDAFNPGITTKIHGEAQSPRERVLTQHSQVQVTLNAKGKIIAGQWKCPYTGNVYISPMDVDIDHIVPLAEAWVSGAKKWSAPQRASYCRDEENLIPVSSDANREKGRKSLEQWMPPIQDRETHIWYIQRWLHTKRKYDLGLSAAEIQFIAQYAPKTDA